MLSGRLEDAAARTTDETVIDGELEMSLAAAVRDLAQVIPTAKTAAQQGYLVFNPCSFVRRTRGYHQRQQMILARMREACGGRFLPAHESCFACGG